MTAPSRSRRYRSLVAMASVLAVVLALAGGRHASALPPILTITVIGALGGFPAQVTAMNAGGQVVGERFLSGPVAFRAFSWTPSGGMVELGTLGGGSSTPLAVNAGGQVVGTSTTSAGVP